MKMIFVLFFGLLLILPSCNAIRESSKNTGFKSGEKLPVSNSDKEASAKSVVAEKGAIEGASIPADCIDPMLIDNLKNCKNQSDNQVCGCDGKTYRNPCEANKAGVKYLKRGPCVKVEAM